ncbi:GIY-YIG nuclease family protein [Pseudoalteromonas sp. C2R02]|uniref:GIY-YIG nuclease family protein n=1 Tax=Pseudoalteromonas sp. C2R02 TaxID=2841565 RepID=UPI001C0886CC|nr:GIY-YIG nuclease family protein [Pseudoalteromonas sp. C2R02]MBU2971770.1 GIY-YIG nuclease family protein [Pseudoalteromonas sp. C2R02]
MKAPAIYILTNKPNGSLYIGVTSNLVKRVWQHRQESSTGFTSKYNIKLLVYYEVFDDMYNAISREKQLKKWNRQWKIHLIESKDPKWQDLYSSII